VFGIHLAAFLPLFGIAPVPGDRALLLRTVAIIFVANAVFPTAVCAAGAVAALLR
jgi:hypothetical protein